MNSNQIIRIIRDSTGLLSQDFDGSVLSEIDATTRTYDKDEISEFNRDLTEAANKLRVIYLENSLKEDEFEKLLHDVEIPIIAYEEAPNDFIPIIIYKKKGRLNVLRITVENTQSTEFNKSDYKRLYQQNGKIAFMGVFSYKSMVSDNEEDDKSIKKLSPTQRLFRLLSEEKKDVMYVFVYAVLIGLISLTLPLGIQAIVSLISGGVVFSSVYVLIGLVIIGVLVTGGLQVMQLTLVEYLQRRVFTKSAFEFAFRIPRIKSEALLQYYPPELMNRFFDVLTIQKGLPKLLIDLSAGAIQIVFGLLLLSFYHPFFVFFSMILVGMLTLTFYITGPKALSSSIKESKFKYKVVYWLEELARTINSFKLSGNTPLPIRKTDYNVNNYLKNRKAHFRVLISQYAFILLFKALVTGGLLIIGTILVIQKEITLGQFVASEVIIILILSSVEKIIMYMDVIYDMLTAVDKISHVTDLPLEKRGGFDIPNPIDDIGLAVRTKNLKYKFPDEHDYALNGVDLIIESGERICIAGAGGSGKTILVDALAGLNVNYEGIITMDGYSLRDLDLTNLRDSIGKNVSQQDIFEGSIIENILLAKSHAKSDDAIWAVNLVGIADDINSMPYGLETSMLSAGKGLPSSLINRIILARCLAKRPRLLILNDFFNGFLKFERLNLISMLADPKNPWTLIAVSNDPVIMAACGRVVIMEKGAIKKSGPFEELIKSDELSKIIN
jgi:ABC-type bacteriocin/lantibiotic exporter with double-glycine peptidase domain